MTAVTYHGEYPEGQVNDENEPFILHEGYEWTPGTSVTVTDDEVLKRLATNRFFKLPKADKDEIERGLREAEEAEVQTLKTWLTDHKVPFHGGSGLVKLQGLKADYQRQLDDAAQG